MFGQNPIRAQVRDDGLTLWVQEVFHTIQGEGPLQGHASIFLRLGGCNLRCFWCDTDFESSTWTPHLGELVARIDAISEQTGTRLVVLTGGEPFRQNIRPLVTELLGKGYRLQIETNGTLWVDLPEDDNLLIVCSPKTPTLNANLRKRVTAYKYVVGAEEADGPDGLPSRSTQMRGSPAVIARPDPGVPIYISPRDDYDPAANAANMRVCAEIVMKHHHILSLQIHKFLGID